MVHIVKKVSIKASAAEVWQVITSPNLLEKWIGMSNNIKPVPGHMFEFKADEDIKHYDRDRVIQCRIIEINENKRISFTWKSGLMNDETIVTIELAEKDEITELKLTHSGFDSVQEKEQMSNKWRDKLSTLNYMLTEKQNIKLIADTALFAGNKTLLVKYTPANKYDLQKGWFVPDDAMKHGEHPEDAALRILKEQLGIEGYTPKHAFIESFTGGDKSWHLVFHYFVKVDENISLKPVNDIAEARWFEIDSMPDDKEVAHHGWAKYIIEEILRII